MPRFEVHRSTKIEALPETVYETLVDFRTWATWSPWLCAEPEASVIVSENPRAVGSNYCWSGSIVGTGEIQHKLLEPGRRIIDELCILKPWKSKSEVGFLLEPDGEGTRVTWFMKGSLPWFLFWMIPQLEPLIGMDYERGLRMLKEWVETGRVDSRTQLRGIEPIGPLRMAGVKRQCAFRELPDSMSAAFEEVRQCYRQHGLATDTEAISVYHLRDFKSNRCEYTAGYLLPEEPGRLPRELLSWSIPSLRAVRVTHTGRYVHLGNAWSTGHQFVRYRHHKLAKVDSFEIYRNKPGQTLDHDLVTDVYIPLR